MIKGFVLNENTAGKRGMLAEHGLSLLLEKDGKQYLFDTGQTDVFMKNADRLGVDLTKLYGIILSHGHFDHCGGLEFLIQRYKEEKKELPPIYVREKAFLKKFAVNNDQSTYREIGIPWERALAQASARLTSDKEQIGDNVWVLGNIPYTVAFEQKPGIFFTEENGKKQPDFMEDEQMLVIEEESGFCVFGGCCHAGIINCLSYLRKAFPGKRISSVFAGMHLTGASKERIEQTVEELKKLDLDILIPVHCTGIEAIGRLKMAFGGQCLLMETGKSFELGAKAE